MQAEQIKLHDIQPILEVQEFSLYYLSAIVIVLALLFGFLLYKIFLWIQSKKKFNKRKAHKTSLETINVANTKEAAYAMGFYGATFKDDTARHNEIYGVLQEHLEAHKYKKQVEPFDEKTLHYYNLYKEMCDV
ncbi:MAG: hypothetical protein RBR59_04145 [Sulfurimonadaceae bacterium]|jgi:hypothetical protein|nr:hypothetical protein [Sulfurimonadaceae bacterium]